MKHLYRLITLLVLAAAALTVRAEIPAGYYTPLNGKNGTVLKTAVYNLVRNFTKVSSYIALPSYFVHTDTYPESRRWWDMYSNIPLYAPSFSGLNREHSFPKSWWGGSEQVSAYVDLNHLYPSEMRANTAKSNYPLGTVDRSQNTKFDNGCCLVGYPVTGQGGGAQYVFEPADEYKGDFARTYFYMVCCYQNLKWKYTYMVSQNLWPTLNRWSVDLLLKWHRQDPVSEKETLRNEAVYKIQNNRNPFIDYPSLAEYIWGDRQDEAFDASGSETPVGDPVLITPVQDMDLEFGQVALGKSATAKLFFAGRYLKGSLSVMVYRDDAKMFSIPTSAIAANLVNAEDGYWLNVTYTPTALGDHTARLLIYDGGITGSRDIVLRGSCLPVPTLTAPTATAPTDVTEDSYVANWTTPQDEVVDYWVITRTCYKEGNAEVSEIEAEGPGTEITGLSQSEYETYSVQSVRLGYRSPASNVVTVVSNGITDVTDDRRPLAVMTYPGGLRIVVSENHTNLRVYDTTGRLVALREVVTSGSVITLPAGVYLIVTDQQKRPVRVLINE